MRTRLLPEQSEKETCTKDSGGAVVVVDDDPDRRQCEGRGREQLEDVVRNARLEVAQSLVLFAERTDLPHKL